MAIFAAARAWIRRRWPAVTFLVAACGAGVLIGGVGRQASAAAGTAVCGELPQGTATWNAAGSPYLLCPAGVTVPQASTLNIDGSGGPVQVQATGSGGLAVVGGTFRTLNTGPTAHVAFDGSAATRGAWAGISIDKDQFGADQTDITLSYVDIAHAKIGIKAQARTVAFDHLNVTESGVGVLADAPVAITNSAVRGTDADGLHVRCGGAGQVSLTGDVVEQAGTYGIEVEPYAECDFLTVTGNTVTGSGIGSPRYPAIRIDNFRAGLGPGQAIAGNAGGGNGLDALALSGTVTGNVTWVAPTNGSAPHPLGYVDMGLHVLGPSTLTIPAGTTVKGAPNVGSGPTGEPPHAIKPTSLELDGSVLDASAGGATFTSLSDNSTGLALCPSVLVTNCSPSPGDFGGISVENPSASATISAGTIRYAEVGLYVVGGFAGGPAGASSVTVGDSTIDHSLFGVISAGSGSSTVNVTGGAVSDITNDAVDIEDIAQATVSGVAVSRAGGGGIRMTLANSAPKAMQVINNTVDSVGLVGIQVNAVDPVVRNNTVTDSGHGASLPRLAMVVGGCCGDAFSESLGPTGDVDGNVGSGNGIDAMSIAGTVTNSFTWVTAKPNQTSAPFGYVIGQPVTMNGPLTLTVPADAVVKGYSLTFNGATLDATAGGATFTGLQDDSFGIATCPALAICEDASNPGGTFGYIDLHASPDGMSKGNAALVRARIVRPDGISIDSGAGASPGHRGYGLAIDSSTVSDAVASGVMASSTPVLVQDSSIERSGRFGFDLGSGGAQSRVTGSVLADNAVMGAGLNGAVDMSGTRLTGNGGGDVNFGKGVGVSGPDPVTISCSAVRSNRVGIASDANSLSVSESDLVGNDRNGNMSYDLDAEGPVSARMNWWGQAGGPKSGQVKNPQNADTSQPLDSPSSCIPPTPPDSPANPSASGGESSATVSWSAPLEDGGSPITGYIVTTSPGGATTSAPADSSSTQVTGLTNGESYTFKVTAMNAVGTSPPSVPTNAVTPGTAGTYFPLTPARILDTRPYGPVGPNSSIDLPVAGSGGVPQSGVSAVVLNVTGTEPTAGTYLTVWPTGQPRPTASNLNLTPGQTVPNLVVAKVGANGRVSIYNAQGYTHVIVDVAGWYSDGSTTAGARYTALTPARILDTRPSNAIAPDSSRDLQVTGAGGVPTSGVSAVVLNVTGTEPTAGTYLTVWPTGQPRPTASNLNLTPGQTVPNLVVAKVGANGRVSIYNAQGSTHVVVDVAGWFGADGA